MQKPNALPTDPSGCPNLGQNLPLMTYTSSFIPVWNLPFNTFFFVTSTHPFLQGQFLVKDFKTYKMTPDDIVICDHIG